METAYCAFSATLNAPRIFIPNNTSLFRYTATLKQFFYVPEGILLLTLLVYFTSCIIDWLYAFNQCNCVYVGCLQNVDCTRKFFLHTYAIKF